MCELLQRDARLHGRLIDRLPAQNFRNVVIVLQATGSELHRDQVLRLGNTHVSSGELDLSGARDDLIAMLVFPDVDLTPLTW
jgi:hypothetical protein